MKQITIIIFLFLCSGCSSRSQEDFQQEGQRIAVLLTHELQSIHTREELLQRSSKLNQLFEELVEVAIAARQYRQQHPWEELVELKREEEQVNVRLQAELARVCRLEGGREAIEKCQEASLMRLDAHQKRGKVL
ncbi:MAG: hypothetical protein Q8K75_08955 [Chlamydiales bacterium]|nr:hypothetical protein [Chlamydiales bacterium]